MTKPEQAKPAMGLLLLVSLLALSGSVPVPRGAPPVGRWEGYVLHMAATLRAQQLSGLHFLCRSQCVSPNLLRRVGRHSTLAYTVSVGGAVLPSWPVTTRNLFVLVGMDCGVLANVTLHARDVVVIVSFRTREALLSRAAGAFESCWRLDVLDAVAVAAGRGSLLVYTYLPYRAGRCRDMGPQQVAEWTPRSAQHPAAFGLVAKVRDLGGCPLRVTAFQTRPWTDLIPVNKTGRFVLGGTYAPFLATLARYMNFTPDLAQPTDGNAYGNAADFPHFGGALGDVYHNRSDFCLAFSPSDIQMPYHGRPPTAQSACTTWCLPTGYRQSSVWRPVVGEFTTQSWAAVLASYVVAALSHWLLSRSRALMDSALAALQSLVSSISAMPANWAPRFFMFCWSFSGLVLATLYMAALQSINSSESVDTLFRTVEELDQSPLPVYSSADQLRNFKQVILLCDETKQIWALSTLCSQTHLKADCQVFKSSWYIESSSSIYIYISLKAPCLVVNQKQIEWVNEPVSQMNVTRKAQFDSSEKALMARVRMFDYSNAVPMFRRFFVNPDRGILTDRNACQAWAVLFTPPRKAPRFHVIRNYCFSVSMAYNLVVRRRSPLLRPFSVATSRLDEAGLTMHWFDSKVLDVAHSQDPVMRMRQLIPFLILLGIGLCAASITFLLEILIARSLSCCRPASRRSASSFKKRDDKPAFHNPEDIEYWELRRRLRL
ncbi:uncharacterized protein LOC117646583 [Thrips palmi]|uniref:Uncharacterized protein LOC117646583 n=1 Tax=Thrips palmi TaxID=161013 RepID=A0A6P8Z1L5_THRPL|nr:uncharacterized protein LOC117646583 [Thrips palmi]